MSRIVFPALFAAVSLATASPAAASTLITLPAFSEAVFGTPDAQLIWEGPDVTDTLILFRSLGLLNVEFSFKINATPGAKVDLNPYGSGPGAQIGVIGDNGVFESGWVSPFVTSAGYGYDILAVGERWTPNGSIKTETFTFYDFQVRATQAPPLPEPATWALMIMGFGASGVALRGRRRRTA